MSLIRKLIEKLTNTNESTKKRLMSTALALTLTILTAVGLAGCGTNTDPSTKPGTTITDPSGDTNTDENGNNNTEDNKYSKYSSILQGVMTKDSYKVDLIYGHSRMNSAETDKVINNNRFLPIPYAFLEELGYNIAKVKDNLYDASAEVFRIDHDLYVALGIETEASTNYITNYLLKYKVTDQEIKEMSKLFMTLTSTYYNYTYFQAPFFIQELSYQKTPEVLNISRQSKDTQKTIISGLNYNKFVQYSNNNAIMLNFRYAGEPYTTYYYNCVTWPASESAHSTNVNLGLIELYSEYGKSFDPIQNIDNKEVLNLKYLDNIYLNVKESGKSPYKKGESIVKADVYSSTNRVFEDINLHNNWKNTFV